MSFVRGQKIICVTQQEDLSCLYGTAPKTMYPVYGNTYTFLRYGRKINGKRFIQVKELKLFYAETIFSACTIKEKNHEREHAYSQ